LARKKLSASASEGAAPPRDKEHHPATRNLGARTRRRRDRPVGEAYRLARAPRPPLPRRRRPSARCRRSNLKEIGRRRGPKLGPDSARRSAPPRARGWRTKIVNADLPVAVLPIDQLYAHGDGRIGTAETLETARDVCGYPRPASQSSLFFLGSSSVDVPGFFFCMRCGGLTCHMRCAARAGLRPLTMRTKYLAAKYEPHRPTRRP
jgi:hypothetical protein